MNQTATEYYSEMLEIQKNLAVLKEKVLKRSERVWRRKRDRVEKKERQGGDFEGAIVDQSPAEGGGHSSRGDE